MITSAVNCRKQRSEENDELLWCHTGKGMTGYNGWKPRKQLQSSMLPPVNLTFNTLHCLDMQACLA